MGNGLTVQAFASPEVRQRISGDCRSNNRPRIRGSETAFDRPEARPPGETPLTDYAAERAVMSKHPVRDVNDAKEAIMAAFRAFDIRPGQYLPFQSLLSKSDSWSKDMRVQLEAAIASLVTDTIIEWQKTPPGYRLLRQPA